MTPHAKFLQRQPCECLHQHAGQVPGAGEDDCVPGQEIVWLGTRCEVPGAITVIKTREAMRLFILAQLGLNHVFVIGITSIHSNLQNLIHPNNST